MARLLVFACYQAELYAALLGSADETLAGVAGKAVKEVAYHVDHAHHWVVRLGDGTDESHARMQAALDAEWPYVEELFTPVDPALVEAGIAADPTALRTAVLERVAEGPRRGDPGRARGDAPARRRSPRAAHRGLRLRGGRDAAPGPLAPGGPMVTTQTRSQPGLGAGRRGTRPGDPRRHDRGPRHPARRGRGRPRLGARAGHPDLLRLPGHGRHRRRPGGAAHRGRLPARRRRVRAVPGLDHRRHQRGRPGQAGGVRRRSAVAHPRRARGPRALGALPAVRQPRHPGDQPLRLDRLQVAVGVPLLPEPFDHFKAL